MKIHTDLQISHYAAIYQCIEMARLNNVLKDNGVTNPDLRRTICEEYFFDSGQFIDAGWFLEADRRIRPGVYFTPFDPDTDPDEPPAEIWLPNDQGSMFHDYAHGAATWLFEDVSEDPSEIQTGEIYDDLP